jgi:hypothetical protein
MLILVFDGNGLERVAIEYDKARLDIGLSCIDLGNSCIVDAHFEAIWKRQEPGLWKSFVTNFVPNTWCRSKTFEELQSRGEQL